MKEEYIQALIKGNIVLCPRCRGGVIANYKKTDVHCSNCGDKCGKIIRKGG